MPKTVVDLNTHINQDRLAGNPADFPLTFTRAMYMNPATGVIEPMPSRQIVARADTGRALSIVSDRYTLVPHSAVLDMIERTIDALDVGPVPRGIYMSGGGAKMRALYKFPALERAIRVDALHRKQDRLCPLIKVTNSLDGTSKITIEIGAFSFVCTNFAVGGSGVFAGGFMALHAGTINIEAAGNQLKDFLAGFDAILNVFAHWSQIPASQTEHEQALAHLPERYSEKLLAKRSLRSTVFDVYNDATEYCTHQLRSASRALRLLADVNRGFQNVEQWRVDKAAVPETASLVLRKAE